MKLHVEVTQEDINNGERQDSENCPIACALKRLVQNPEVEKSIEFDFEEQRFISRGLTLEISNFIAHFDDGNDVKPFSFELEAYEKYNEEGFENE